MSECRICLGTRRNVRSIFEPADRNIATTYADMITYVASIKIVRDDGITDQICLQCQKKLCNLYDFKLLIQRSNTSLHQKVNSNLKTIHFNDITDIKFEVELNQMDEKYLLKDYEDIKMNLISPEDTICYKGTTIKKIESNIMNEGIQNGPMSVDDFLKTIKEDPEDDCDPDFDADASYNGDSTDNDVYIPPQSSKKKKKMKYKKNDRKKRHKRFNEKENDIEKGPSINRVCIKPVILNDLRVQKTLGPKKIGPKNKCYNYKKQQTICPYCGKLTGNIKSHLLIHSEPTYKCSQCERKYYTRKSLTIHMETHSNIKPFKCDQCIASFHNITYLKSHMASHRDERKFVCDVCSKSYKRAVQLRRHARTHNSANKTHKCEMCNMSFFTGYNLRHHLRVHTGERPFNCELCSQPYSYKHDFNRHCLKKHGIFLKRRSVNVMNEEVLARERLVMKELMLRAHGLKEGDQIPFEGPQAHQAFEQAIKTFRSNPLTLSLPP